MIVENDYPILEYSTQQDAVINPGKGEEAFPRLCIMTFFGEVMDSFLEKYPGRVIGIYISEMRHFPAYRITYNGTEICLIQAVVASGSIAMMTDWLYGRGVEVLLCCGGCGVLADIPAGDVMIPVRALRDEGASYKYLPPARYIDLQEEPVRIFEEVLTEYKIPYIECTTWTTDGFYRETRDKVNRRRQSGCICVDMECSAMAAMAGFREKELFQFFYAADNLDGEVWDSRGLDNEVNLEGKDRVAELAMELAVRAAGH